MTFTELEIYFSTWKSDRNLTFLRDFRPQATFYSLDIFWNPDGTGFILAYTLPTLNWDRKIDLFSIIYTFTDLEINFFDAKSVIWYVICLIQIKIKIWPFCDFSTEFLTSVDLSQLYRRRMSHIIWLIFHICNFKISKYLKNLIPSRLK